VAAKGHAVDRVGPTGPISVPPVWPMSVGRRIVANNTTASLRSSVYDIERLLGVFECVKNNAQRPPTNKRLIGLAGMRLMECCGGSDVEVRDVICGQTTSPAD